MHGSEDRGGGASLTPRTQSRQLALTADAATALATASTLECGAQGWGLAVVRHLDATACQVWLGGSNGAPTRMLAEAGDPQIWARPAGEVAELALPLLVGGRAVGRTVARFARPPDHTVESDFRAIAEVLAGAIARSRGPDDPATLAAIEAASFSDRLTALIATGSWQQASQHVLREAVALTDARHAFFGAMLPGQTLRILAVEGFGVVQRRREPARASDPEGLLDLHASGAAWRAALVEQTAQLSRTPDPAAFPPGHPPVERHLTVPVLDDGEVVGLISVANRERDFEPTHRADLERLATVAGLLCKCYLSFRQQMLLEDQVRQAQHLESVGRLAACIAHDFNNLLTVILGQCSLLADNESHDPAESLGDIRNAAERASALVRDLLSYSRKQMLHPRRLQVNELLRKLRAELEEILGRSIQVELHLAASVGEVLADPSIIEQVVMRLALNARDAMPDGGSMIVETSDAELDTAACADQSGATPGNYTVIAVSDTGRGIGEAIRPHIFEPFYSSKPFGQKSGLGLASAQGAIAQTGGHIRVYSEPEKGSTFRVYLPHADAAGTRGLERGPVHRPVPRETVLLVDDTDGVRRTVGKMLRQLGYEVLEAAGGQEALDLCRNDPRSVELLLTDVMMPAMNGPELFERLVIERPGIRPLYISGYTERVALRHNLLGRGFAFLSKPFGVNALSRKIREVLDVPERSAGGQ